MGTLSNSKVRPLASSRETVFSTGNRFCRKFEFDRDFLERVVAILSCLIQRSIQFC